MAEYQLPKLATGVRFPSLAPGFIYNIKGYRRMALRVLLAFILAVSASGCKSSSGAVRTSSSYVPRTTMIIHENDIEMSSGGTAQYTTPAPRAAPPSVNYNKSGASSYRVRRGDTLWSISRMYNVEVSDLASANGLANSGRIETGQILKIPAGLTAKSERQANYSPRRGATFVWPVRGVVASSYGSKTDNFINKGIDIRAAAGAVVSASRSGKVVYCDSKLKGFGNTVIIDHLDGFQTVYSYNDAISVKVGDIVDQRDPIARVGSSGRAKESMLHFEIRRNGEPQNPEFYLSR